MPWSGLPQGADRAESSDPVGEKKGKQEREKKRAAKKPH
jgi:hypothetical protein